mmetsp:Transcript_5507/g.15281  ORF Transcript_5507/g.15281 Transcript_5507/m.15281 type:complete len:213 (-) Transcript_5507:154-792(-)
MRYLWPPRRPLEATPRTDRAAAPRSLAPLDAPSRSMSRATRCSGVHSGELWILCAIRMKASLKQAKDIMPSNPRSSVTSCCTHVSKMRCRAEWLISAVRSRSKAKRFISCSVQYPRLYGSCPPAPLACWLKAAARPWRPCWNSAETSVWARKERANLSSCSPKPRNSTNGTITLSPKARTTLSGVPGPSRKPRPWISMATSKTAPIKASTVM